jgi:hypothetical protein
MRNLLNKLLLFPFLLGLYFPLSIISQNLREIDLRSIPRSLLAVTLVVLALLVLLRLVLKSWQKSALLTTLLLIGFFLYGLTYSIFKQPGVLGGLLGRHRILLPLFLMLVAACAWLIIRNKSDFSNAFALLNLMGVFLCLMTLVSFASFWLSQKPFAAVTTSVSHTSPSSPDKPLPDVYFFVLDAYDRQDYLQKNFRFNNSAFIEELRRMGFFVADCSRPNYAHTILSLSSTLNMQYLQDFDPALLNDFGLTDKLVHSHVRELLESRGYSTVSFANVHWDFSDADTFLDFPNPFFSPYLQSIEGMLLEQSMLRALVDLSPSLRGLLAGILNSPVRNHYQQQLSIIERLPEAQKVASPKFVFVHIEKPHGPFVFDADGSQLQEDAYYRDAFYSAISREYFESGYTKQIEFLNQRMLIFLEDLLKYSKTPPIILLEGDHGLGEEKDLGSRLNNLLAVHFPNQDYSQLYKTITPVNIFRAAFSQFLGEQLPLLPDKTYYSAKEFRLDFTEQSEEMPTCQE